jgi:hypothetical protein
MIGWRRPYRRIYPSVSSISRVGRHGLTFTSTVCTVCTDALECGGMEDRQEDAKHNMLGKEV